jgi:hypothetical protein
MINVYIEYGSATDHVATLQDEWVYMALLPSLEKLAEDNRGTLSESVFEDTKTPCIPEKMYLLMSATKHDVYDNGSVMKVFATESKARAYMEEMEIGDKLSNCEMYDYWIKGHSVFESEEQNGTLQH